MSNDEGPCSPESSSSQSLSSHDEICVFLMNRIGICVSGSEASTTQELVNKVSQTWFSPRSFNYNQLVYSPNETDEIIKFFTLWITSPLLELQLKPLHRPFKVLKHWESLVSKYGYQDGRFHRSVNMEPIVSFQRNIFTQKWEEMRTQNPDILQLLYEEAKVNVLDGRYPVDTFEELAAIQAAIEIGPFNPKLHSSSYLKRVISQLFGSIHRQAAKFSISSTFSKHSSLESKIIYYYRRLTSGSSKTQLYRSYLQLCWPLPYYGSAYFHGLIERSARNFISLVSNRLVQVWIAINPIGAHIIDEKHSRLIVSLHYKRFKWELSISSKDQRDNSSVPSLFFYFWSPNDYKTSIIQVISPQAYLMDTLLNAFTDSSNPEYFSRRNRYTIDADFNYDFDLKPSPTKTTQTNNNLRSTKTKLPNLVNQPASLP